MNMERLINDISNFLERELGLSADSKEVAVYGLYVFFSTLTGVVSIILVGWLLDVVGLSLVAVITASGLRVLSGGAHSLNLRNCTLLGAIMAPGIALVAKHLHGYFSPQAVILLVIFAGLTGILSIIRYAPADTPNKPIISESFKNRLRKLSLTYTFLWFLVMAALVNGLWIAPRYDVVLASTLGIIWQSFSLTPRGYWLVAVIDELLP